MLLTPAKRGEIARKLRNVIDPELGVNIVDLGLVYNIYEEEQKVVVEYTATTPGCPMRRYLEQQVEKVLAAMDGIEQYEARLVWQPEWTVDMLKPDVEFFSYPPPLESQ